MVVVRRRPEINPDDYREEKLLVDGTFSNRVQN